MTTLTFKGFRASISTIGGSNVALSHSSIALSNVEVGNGNRILCFGYGISSS